jgi:hypothetical protein
MNGMAQFVESGRDRAGTLPCSCREVRRPRCYGDARPASPRRGRAHLRSSARRRQPTRPDAHPCLDNQHGRRDGADPYAVLAFLVEGVAVTILQHVPEERMVGETTNE